MAKEDGFSDGKQKMKKGQLNRPTLQEYAERGAFRFCSPVPLYFALHVRPCPAETPTS